MRNQRNIGYDAFNSYRSGHENPSRHDFNATHDTNRGSSSVYGHMSHDESEPDYNSGITGSYNNNNNYSASQHHSPSNRSQGYGSSESYSSQPQNRYGSGSGNQYSSNQYSQPQNSRQSSQSWMSQGNSSMQNSSGNYGQAGNRSTSSQYGNSGSSNYGSSNYGNSNYGNRHNDSMLERAGDQLQNWGNRMSNAWDRWTDDDDSRSSRSMNRNNDWIRNGQHDYSHGNAGQNRYSDNYENSGNYGSPHHYGNSGNSGYSSQDNRYGGNRSHYESRRDEGGFFDHVGNWISNTWDNLVGNSDEEQRRYEERSRYGNTNRRTSSNDGPPYNYGSASERDYQW